MNPTHNESISVAWANFNFVTSYNQIWNKMTENSINWKNDVKLKKVF